MKVLYRTVITEVGPDVPELLDGGNLILFKAGAPAEPAEVSVLHDLESQTDRSPVEGDAVVIGDTTHTITAIGATDWAKAVDIGHLTFNFSGKEGADRPGEICVSHCPAELLSPSIRPGAIIGVISRYFLK